MSDTVTIPKEALKQLLKEVVQMDRASLISPTMTDLELWDKLGKPSKATLNRFIKGESLSYHKVGDRKIFIRAQVEKRLRDLITNPLKKAS